MKQKYYIGFLALVLALAFTGCVHDDPDGGGIDPTLVEVETEVTLDLALVPLQTIAQTARSGTTRAEDGYRRRFIIEAWREGKPEARQVTVMEEAEEEGKGITLPVNLKLHAVEYTLAVWTDYVVAGTTDDLWYDTEDLQCVACTEPYTGGNDYRDCLYGTATLDLRPYRDEWNAKVQIKVDMVRPLAKYELIATDVKDFLAHMKKQKAADTGYTITFSYGFFFPTVFNVLAGRPVDSATGITFTTPLTLPADGAEECTIGSDFVFVNGAESFVSLTIEVKDGTHETISRISGVEVPYRRGHLTTVRGRFLTTLMEGGVTINPGYDGEFDINLGDL